MTRRTSTRRVGHPTQRIIRIFLAAGATLMLLTTATLPASADDEPTYELPLWQGVDERPDSLSLDVLVIPPATGPLQTDAGLFGGGAPEEELDPFRNSYVRAIEDAAAGWVEGAETFGPAWLADAFEVHVHVAGRTIPSAQGYHDADVVVVTGGVSPVYLGLTQLTAAAAGGPCLIHDTIMGTKRLSTFNYQDMYNVFGHELGHCLGLDHTSDEPRHDMMNGGYTHFPGTASTHLHCVSNLDVKAVAASLQHLVGEPVYTGSVTVSASEYASTDCED